MIVDLEGGPLSLSDSGNSALYEENGYGDYGNDIQKAPPRWLLTEEYIHLLTNSVRDEGTLIINCLSSDLAYTQMIQTLRSPLIDAGFHHLVTIKVPSEYLIKNTKAPQRFLLAIKNKEFVIDEEIAKTLIRSQYQAEWLKALQQEVEKL